MNEIFNNLAWTSGIYLVCYLAYAIVETWLFDIDTSGATESEEYYPLWVQWVGVVAVGVFISSVLGSIWS